MKEFLDMQINNKNFKWINMENREFLKNLLEEITNKNNDEIKLEKAGKEIYEKIIPFSKLAIFLDQFSYTLDLETKEIFRKNINILAKGYLNERLPKEIQSIKHLIHSNINLISKENIEIITELTSWLENLVNSFINDSTPPKIEKRIQTFIDFVNERGGSYFDNEDVKKDFLITNKNFYENAIECINFFEQKEYYYFSLLYIELIALFLKMTNMLNSMFLEEKLVSIYIDPITLLGNRFQLIKDLPTFNQVHILVINVNSFSKLNLLYGYEKGDFILKLIGNYLKNSPLQIKSYRIYADEFAIICKNEDDIKNIFNELNKNLFFKSNDIDNKIYTYGVYDKLGKNVLEKCELILANSDKKELINAKEKNNIFEKYQNQLNLSMKLRKILINDDIIPFYQPIYGTHNNNKIIKYEVLMRVKDGDKILTPAEFLDVLKEMPFYTEFTKSILVKSYETFKDNDLTFSVNFTLADIKDKGIKKFLNSLIKEYPETTKRLTIEIIESDALNEFELLNNFINYYKKYGITFALDDFGSGYSNFAQFAKLNIDFIKIDGSIIVDVLKNEKMQKLVDSIILFAKNLNLKTIAEFVSNKELFEYLKDKVDMIQGYYIGKPEPYLI